MKRSKTKEIRIRARRIFALCFLSILALLSSCDVPGRLTIKNLTQHDLTVNVEMIHDGDSISSSVTIPNDKGNNSVQWMFGFGHFWTDDGIKNYLEEIKNITITSASDTIILTDNKETFEFLRKRRRGLRKKGIVIKVK